LCDIDIAFGCGMLALSKAEGKSALQVLPRNICIVRANLLQCHCEPLVE